MAKQDSGANTTLSTRFDEQELALLRQAAKRKQWSLSQLIRVGAYEKAVNIVNANSPAAFSVRRLLAQVVTQLFNARVMVSAEGPWVEEPAVFQPSMFNISDDVKVYATTLESGELDQLSQAIHGLGAELAPMLNEEFIRAFADRAVGKLIDPTVVALQASNELTEGTPEPDGDQDQKKSKGVKRTSKRKTNRKEK